MGVDQAQTIQHMIAAFGVLCSLLFAIIAAYAKAHFKQDDETRAMLLEHIRDCNEVPKALLLDRIENLHATVLEVKQRQRPPYPTTYIPS